jgi:hypothetical protein
MSNMTILLSSRCMSCLHLRAWSGHAELGAGQATRARLAVAVTTRRRKSGANSTCSRARADRSAQQDIGDTDGHATWPWFATVVPSRSASSQHPRAGHARGATSTRDKAPRARIIRRAGAAETLPVRRWQWAPLPRSVTRSSVSPERALEGFARAAARRAMTGQKRRLASCGCCRATGFRSLREEPFGSMGRRRSARSLRRERRQTHEALTPIDSDGGVVAGASDGQHGMFR